MKKTALVLGLMKAGGFWLRLVWDEGLDYMIRYSAKRITVGRSKTGTNARIARHNRLNGGVVFDI